MAIKKKRKLDHLGDLEDSLNQEFEQTYRESLYGKVTSLYAFGFSLLLLGTGLLVWSQNYFSSSSQSVYRPSSVAQSSSQKANLAKELVAGKGDFRFLWTWQDYLDLYPGNGLDVTGDALQDIIRKFGKATAANFSDVGDVYLYLDYMAESQDAMDRRRVRLTFYKVEEQYYLISKRAYFFTDDRFATQQGNFVWTKDSFDQVMVGDADTGKGGYTYDEIIALGGLPTRATLEGYNEYGLTGEVVRITYKRDQKSVTFQLKAQEDGTYRVTSKVAEF